MAKKFFLLVLMGAAVFAQTAFASEVDILLQKLVDKGVLSAGEAREVSVETKEQIKKDISSGKADTIPQWVQNIKLKGDFRARYQYDHAKRLAPSTVTNDTHRARIRVRLGLDAKVNDKITVGVGLATGTTDVTNKDAARSPNQTLTDGFAKKPIALDYAFVQYAATPWATITAGRMKNPLWEPGDLIWDTDTNPEGGVVKLSKKICASNEMFATAGVFVLDEGAFGADPTMFVIQNGVIRQFGESIALKAAVSYMKR